MCVEGVGAGAGGVVSGEGGWEREIIMCKMG